MSVTDGRVAMRVQVRLGSLPPFMLMFVVFIVDVQMFVLIGGVRVLQHNRIIGCPNSERNGGCRNAQDTKNGERSFQANHQTGPTSQRIADQPAKMRHGKLGGVDGRSIAFAGRAPQQPPGRCLNQRRTDAYRKPNR